ncbi:hypothetical protein CUMW_101710, partial [Citrus unshiu]
MKMLTSVIPSLLGNLSKLEPFDFSSNKLIGLIPMQLASLKFLFLLNFLYNQLEGHKPQGPQLTTFSNDFYT